MSSYLTVQRHDGVDRYLTSGPERGRQLWQEVGFDPREWDGVLINWHWPVRWEVPVPSEFTLEGVGLWVQEWFGMSAQAYLHEDTELRIRYPDLVKGLDFFIVPHTSGDMGKHVFVDCLPLSEAYTLSRGLKEKIGGLV